MEYVCLHHSLIHFRTDRFDKLKYLSSYFFFSSYFLGKVAGRFPQMNGNLGIKILDYFCSHHLKEFNNYFLWEWGARRGNWGTISSSQWEWLFLPWQFDSFTTLWKGKKETMWYNSGWAEELKKERKKRYAFGWRFELMLWY